jgi:hypothetical protein
MSNYPASYANVNRNYVNTTSSSFSAPMGSNETSRQYGLKFGGYRKMKKSRRKKRKHVGTRRRRSQRGGYHQYGSNIPHTTSYSTAGNVLGYTQSMLAMPTPFHKL